MVKKPRSREDHRGWFSILRTGKKSFIDALQNQEQERNPLETDNEDRCTMMAWEAIQAYIGSDMFSMMWKRDFNTYDKDEFFKLVSDSGSAVPSEMLKILLWFRNELPETNFEDDWKTAETQLFGSTHKTNRAALVRCLQTMELIWKNLEFQNNYFAEVNQWLSRCIQEGPLAAGVDKINPRHNKWYKLNKNRATTVPKKEDTDHWGNPKEGKTYRRKPGEYNAKNWDEYEKLLDELLSQSKKTLADAYKRSFYRNPGSMNK